MSITHIKPEALRHMDGKEGLILMGCGGDLQEWLDGINDMLTNENILLNGSKFESCSAFQMKDLTCLLFPFEGVELDAGKLAMWRLASWQQFGGTWLSDFVPNHLDGFVQESEPPERQKPDCPIIGQDSNIFSVMGIASKALKENGMKLEAKEMCSRVTSSSSYHEALAVITEYVNPVSIDEYEEMQENESINMEGL